MKWSFIFSFTARTTLKYINKFVFLSCTVICPTLSNPTNGVIQYSDSFVPRATTSTATYTCTAGYQLSGTAVRMCTTSGWSNSTTPTCTGLLVGSLYYVHEILYFCTATCNDLTSPANGMISYSPTTNPRLQGAVANYTCGTGYDIFGTNRTRTCQSDTTWSGGDIMCQGIFLYCLSL